jgi:hypothetical protein
MPLFYQHNINRDTKLGIWRIDEPESFFLEKVPLKQDVSHPFKRRQHLAGRYLLSYLFPDFPVEEIRIADTDSLFLQATPIIFRSRIADLMLLPSSAPATGWGSISS